MVCLFLHRHYIHSDHKHLKLFEVKFTIHSIPNLLAPPVGNLAGLVLQPRLLGLATCVPPRSRPPWLWEPTAPGGHETVAHKAGRDMIRKTPFGNHWKVAPNDFICLVLWWQSYEVHPQSMTTRLCNVKTSSIHLLNQETHPSNKKQEEAIFISSSASLYINCPPGEKNLTHPNQRAG